MPIFSKKAETAQLDAPGTVIGRGIVLEAASMTGQESVRIDGVYIGNIHIDGSLVLGDSGSIEGDTRAKYFVVAGEVQGNIKCDTVLHFASTARVFGDVETKALIVDEGSQITGRYKVGDRPSAGEEDDEDSFLRRPEKIERMERGERSGEKSYLAKSLEIIDRQ